MRLSHQQKELILKQVNCIGYLTPTRGNYHLEHDQQDNNWHYYKNYNQYDGLASDNPSTWKHNKMYEFKEKVFSGVVVKIETVFVSKTLGICKRNSPPHYTYPCNYLPKKDMGCSIPAATVFYQNGRKRIVPLDCIKEYQYFSNGTSTKNLFCNLEEFINGNLPDNKISVKKDGSIEIENTYHILDAESAELTQEKRYLILDLAKRKTTFLADADYGLFTVTQIFGGEIPPELSGMENRWFNIPNNEYEQIMKILSDQIKKECSFVPSQSYGKTNFERLVNFVNYPFAPELNKFSDLFHRISPEKQYIDWNRTPILYPDGIEENLKRNPHCVKKFIQYTGLPYTSENNKLFLKGHREFAEYLALWHAGFKDRKNIEKLIQADEKKIFAEGFLDKAIFVRQCDAENQIGITFVNTPAFLKDLRILFHFYSEKTVAKIFTKIIFEQEYYFSSDCIEYLKLLSEENILPQNIINKIGNEGFTQYNHDLLMRLYNEIHPPVEHQEENIEISYTEEEKKLQWDNMGYKFCLPENTNRLMDIGSKMNICVGHLYREKAIRKKVTIVYVQKDEDYKLCIELSKCDNQFHLIQKSAFNNQYPQENELFVLKLWCREKGIKYR